MLRDLSFALRMARRNPGVTAAAVIALALGIGATTAIFSVVNGVLLRPLPFAEPRELYAIHIGWAKYNSYNGPFSYPEYQDLVAQSRTMQSIGAYVDGDANLSGAGSPERVVVRWSTPSLLPTLRVQPVVGRNFAADETIKGRNRVAMISSELWDERFGGARDVAGKLVRLDGDDYVIVGVLPRGLRLEQHIDLWLPLTTDAEGMDVRNSHFLTVVGRRRPGAAAATIAADVDAVARGEVAGYPAMFPPDNGFSMRARPLLDSLVGDVRLPLYVLLGAVSFVLLIACANVANLLLARAATRQREIAVRAALGAGRARLVRMLLTESLVLSLVGGGLGALTALWAIDAVVAIGPASLPRLQEVALDLRVLGFTALVAVASGIAFGLVPAITASRTDLAQALKSGGRTMSAGRGRLRKALVVAEVALSLVLLVGAGLMLRSFVGLLRVDPGFRPERALMMRVSLPVSEGGPSEADRQRFVRFYTGAAARLRQLPGVTAAGAITTMPLERGSDRLFDIEGRLGEELHDAQNRHVTPGWFDAMGIPLVRGRAFLDSDVPGTMPVVVVNRAFVRRFFRDGDPLGKHIRLGNLGEHQFPWATIIGVIGDVRGQGLDAPPEPEMYWPLAQTRDAPAMTLVARTQGDPRPLLTLARAAVAEIDAAQPVYDLQPVRAVVDASLAQRRFTLLLLALFAVVALVLAALGIYAVVAYDVTQRSNEIGIRVALGAQARDVMRLVVRDGMMPVAAGLAVGAVAALLLTRVAASLLYGVSAADLATYAVIAGGLGLVALGAILLPARRALRIEPMQALKAE